MAVEKLGYKQVASTSALVKSGPAGYFGINITASATGSVVVYDSTTASGTIVYNKSNLAVGEILNLGSLGFACANGIFVVATNCTVNVLYT